MTIRDRVKAAVPRSVQERVRASLAHYGERTSERRPLPDFLIIGTKRGGTTSLWRYLLEHPRVHRLFPAWNTKTSHYFEENWGRGEAWYRSHFPTERQRAALEKKVGGPTKVGEAAPLYMFHPLAPERVAKVVPDAKLIVLLRDPVERAYSHWKERRTEGKEPLDFAEALAREGERTAGERERLIADPTYNSSAYDWHTYRARGRYLEHLEPWLQLFDRDQLLIMASETLYRDPADSYAKVLDFVALPPHQLAKYEVFNDRKSSPIDPALREELSAYFAPHNAALEERLGMRFSWS
jgi:Sulfotransferase domain